MNIKVIPSMFENEVDLESALHQATLLGKFKAFCEANDSPAAKQRVRNLLANASDQEACIRNFLKTELHLELSETDAHACAGIPGEIHLPKTNQ